MESIERGEYVTGKAELVWLDRKLRQAQTLASLTIDGKISPTTVDWEKVRSEVDAAFRELTTVAKRWT